jgi:hypothetical protein
MKDTCSRIDLIIYKIAQCYYWSSLHLPIIISYTYDVDVVTFVVSYFYIYRYPQ